MKLLAVCLCCLLCSVSVSAETADSLDAFIDSAGIAETIDTISAKAFVEYDSTRVVIQGSGQAEVHNKTRIRILRESGRGYGQVQRYENALVKFEKFEGRVYSATGTEILKRNRKDMRKDCGFGASYTLYNDICLFNVALNAGNFPFTVEYESTEKLLSLFAWPDWQPQWEIPVLNSSYIVEAPLDFDYRTNAISLPDELKPDSQTTDNHNVTSWSATDVAPFDPDPQSPPEFESIQRLEFCPRRSMIGSYPLDAASWQSLARSYYQIARKQLQIDDRLAAEMDYLFGDAMAASDQLDVLHRTLMARQRYVAISIGIGGWQPHSAGDTYANRYGDCKDLSTLYAGLLTRAGFPAYLALIRTKDEGIINPEFPTISNFNHAIVMFLNGADTIWVDPTCSACELGDIPNSVEDTYALVIDPQGGDLVRTPLSKPESNLIERDFKMRIATDNSARFVLDINASGNPSHYLKYAAQEFTADELGDYLRKRNLLPEGLKIENCLFDKFDSTLSRFSCQVTGSIRRAGQKLDNRVHVWSSILPTPISTDPPDLTDRIVPLLRGSTLTVSDHIQVEIPEEWKLDRFPEAQSIESNFGAFTSTAESATDSASGSASTSATDSASSITLSRKHTISMSRIPPPEFDSFSEFQKSCAKAFSTALVFQKK